MKYILISLLFLTIQLYPQQWVQVDSIFNPSGVHALSFSAPFFADIDNDGDYDLFIGNSQMGRVQYYENIGTAENPKFQLDTALLYPIYAGGQMGTNAYYPVLADINGNGNPDLVISGFNGILYYENIGTPEAAEWKKNDTLFVSVNSQIGTDAKPFFVDLTGNGLLDMLVGLGGSFFGGVPDGVTYGYRNTGSIGAPNYVKDNSLVTGIADIGLNAYPALADITGNGLYDLLLGRDLATLIYYANQGSVTSPMWFGNNTLFSGVENSTYWKNPVFCDIDNDGDFDLIYGTADGQLYYYENVGTSTTPQFQLNNELFEFIKIVGRRSTVSFADFDGDGLLDMLSGNSGGRFEFFKNIGDSLNPKFKKQTTNFGHFSIGAYSTPSFVDLTGNGYYDIVAGALNGNLYCYINNGTNFSYNGTIFAGINVGWMSSPAFVDINGNGHLDMLVGSEQNADMKFYVNDGNNNFTLNNTFITGITAPRDAFPRFVDVDGDGDFDLLLGSINGRIVFYENIGNDKEPQWERNDAYFTGVKVGQHAAPSMADLDGDGVLDLVLGDYYGNFTYYKNLEPTSIKRDRENIPQDFVLYQNYPNPFNPVTNISFHLPGESKIILTLHNITGEKIVTLKNDILNSGIHSITLDADKLNLASGVYFYRMIATDLNGGNFIDSKKMILLK